MYFLNLFFAIFSAHPLGPPVASLALTYAEETGDKTKYRTKDNTKCCYKSVQPPTSHKHYWIPEAHKCKKSYGAHCPKSILNQAPV